VHFTQSLLCAVACTCTTMNAFTIYLTGFKAGLCAGPDLHSVKI